MNLSKCWEYALPNPPKGLKFPEKLELRNILQVLGLIFSSPLQENKCPKGNEDNEEFDYKPDDDAQKFIKQQKTAMIKTACTHAGLRSS